MAAKNTYNKIIKYVVTAVCTQPLHFGSAVGGKGEILVHPVDNIPFIQAASISGTFRDYCMRRFGSQVSKELFGLDKLDSDSNSFEFASKIRFEDGVILTENEDEYIKMELRPHVSIDEETGTCKNNIVQGTNQKAGNKFHMEYIGVGTKIKFVMYLYDDQFDNYVKEIISAINLETVQFGGKKSNGCGYMKVEKLLYQVFDMSDEGSRKLWYRENDLQDSEYHDITTTLKIEEDDLFAYKIVVKGKTENRLLVKSLAVKEHGDKAPKAVNMTNSALEYIVPGSSFKGTVKSQMSKICQYLKEQGVHTEHIIGNTFGVKSETHKNGKTGNIRFYDTVVGEKEENDKAALSCRIHIDKFTGGVINGSLFSEKNIFGSVNFRVGILNKNEPEKSCAILIMALRDLAVGIMNVGSGYSIGKGFIDVDTITIQASGKKKSAVINVKTSTIIDNDGIISECFASLKGKEC